MCHKRKERRTVFTEYKMPISLLKRRGEHLALLSPRRYDVGVFVNSTVSEIFFFFSFVLLQRRRQLTVEIFRTFTIIDTAVRRLQYLTSLCSFSLSFAPYHCCISLLRRRRGCCCYSKSTTDHSMFVSKPVRKDTRDERLADVSSVRERSVSQR